MSLFYIHKILRLPLFSTYNKNNEYIFKHIEIIYIKKIYNILEIQEPLSSDFFILKYPNVERLKKKKCNRTKQQIYYSLKPLLI